MTEGLWGCLDFGIRAPFEFVVDCEEGTLILAVKLSVLGGVQTV